MSADRVGVPSCAIVVLNWNGRRHLEVLLPSLYAARARCEQPVAILVVDNRSTDDDVAWLRAEHPAVEIVVAPSNDLLFSLNPVIANRPEDVVIVLNNDMKVDPGFIGPLLSHFGDPQVFAVAAMVFDWDGKAAQLGQRRIRADRYWVTHWFDHSVTSSCYTAEAGGGCSAYRRSYFAELGGFDRLYRPAYWEDFDLSYRAWMRGWCSILEPRSLIYHRGSATLGEMLPGGRLGRLLARNHLLFILANVGGLGFAAGVVARMPYRLIWHLRHGNAALVLGQLAAVPRIPGALLRRVRRPAPVMTPRDIIGALAGPVSSPTALSDLPPVLPA
jgi:hypothetical protein